MLIKPKKTFHRKALCATHRRTSNLFNLYDLDMSDVVLNVSVYLHNIQATILSNLLCLQISLISLLL